MDNRKAGYVYVLQMDGHPYYKIGRTNSLSRRVAQISPVMPTRLKLVLSARVDDCYWAESRLHKELHDRRLNGEWFDLDDECLEIVRVGLLFCQASCLLERIQKQIAIELSREPGPCLYRLMQWGRVLTLSAKRVNRRFGGILQTARKRRERVPGWSDILRAENVA